jgi:integrase
MLFFDFRYQGMRCREYTVLPDTAANRKKMEKVLSRIELEMRAGTFDYGAYFPNSKALPRIKKQLVEVVGEQQLLEVTTTQHGEPPRLILEHPAGPTFEDFADQWVQERSIEWRRSHIRSLLSTLDSRIKPHFGKRAINSITKADVLAFRAALAKEPGRGDKAGLSPKRINEIMGTLRQILAEAADRYDFTSPAMNIKRLRVRKTDVQPFSLDQVQTILSTVRADFKDYLQVRFLTGMRTGEINGLKWKYVDFDHRLILVRETHVMGEDDYTKTDGSQRDIQMSQPVLEALLRQKEITSGVSDYVFCNLLGQPLDNDNFTKRVWYPLLRHLGFESRRPYQTRHTAATLWLAAGEAPEWIARQLGHTSTEMLFKTYSRYVPNMTRQDGSAMERLLASRMGQGPLVRYQALDAHPAGPEIYVPALQQAAQPVPKPRGQAAALRRLHPQGKDRGQAPPGGHGQTWLLLTPQASV